ncbi:hypothetical protein ACVWXM_006250 [Bradyrhizobium sp. GM7.3]
MSRLSELFGDGSNLGDCCSQVVGTLEELKHELAEEQTEIESVHAQMLDELGRMRESIENVAISIQGECHSAVAELSAEVPTALDAIGTALVGGVQSGREAFLQKLHSLFDEVTSVGSTIEHEFQQIGSHIERSIHDQIVGELEHAFRVAVRHAETRAATSTIEMVLVTEISEVLTTTLSPYIAEIIVFRKVAPAIQAAVDLAKGHF